MRELKKYALKKPLTNLDVKFGKRTQAVFDALKGGLREALGRYTLGGRAALSELRKAGMLSE